MNTTFAHSNKMLIETFLHNLKLLGFDESKHANGTIQLNKSIFTRNAVNNDKAFEHICLFLFRRLDRDRVKRELTPNLTIRTYGGKQSFISKVYRWLLDIRPQCKLFDTLHLRKSELLAYYGKNLIKIMIALSTFVLNKTLNQKYRKDIPTTAKPALASIQANISNEVKLFTVAQMTNETYVHKAQEAAQDIENELLSPSQSPLPLSPLQASLPPLPLQAPLSLTTEKETHQLNKDLESIKAEILRNSEQEAKSIHASASEPFITNALPSTENTTISSPICSANITNFTITTLTEPMSHTSVPDISYKSPLYIPHSTDLPLTDKALSPSYSTHSSSTIPTTIHSPPLFSNKNSSQSLNIEAPEEMTLGYPSIKLNAASLPQPIPQNASSDTTSHNNYTHATDSIILAPMQFSYVREPYQLPSFRQHFLELCSRPPSEDAYWFLPPAFDAIDQTDGRALLLTQSFSPPNSMDSEPSPQKRKLSVYLESEQNEEDKENLFIPPSPTRRKLNNEQLHTPPNQIIDLEWDRQSEDSPNNLDKYEMVPPLMDEVAPFRRIYHTDYFDIDFMTPKR